MDYSLLKIELSLPEYSGMTADEKRQHYNNKMVSVSRRVPLSELQSYLAPQGLLPVLEARTSNSTDVDARLAARELMFLFGPYSHVSDVDVNHPRFAAGLAAIETAGDITSAQSAAIVALGTHTVHVSQTVPGLPRYLLTRQVEKAEAT